MTTTLKYERLEINENKCRYLFEEESNDFEALEKLDINDNTFNDLLLKAEVSKLNFFEEKIKHMDIKEQIFLKLIYDIKLSMKNDDSQIIIFETPKSLNNDYTEKAKLIFKEINRVVHKNLHNKKMENGKEIKECIFFDDLNKQIINLEKNNSIDNIICTLKEGNEYFENIAMQSIMISLSNLMTEFVQNYLSKNEKLIRNKIGEENVEYEDKKIDFDLEIIENLNLIESNIFKDIYKDFVYQSNICSSELEEYLKLNLDSFRKKNQINFTLSELYTDIFWNSIFHSKKFCSLFINSYLNEEMYGDIKETLQKIIDIIYYSQPIKNQIVDILGLYKLGNTEEYDLMTQIKELKKINNEKIKQSEIEKEKEKEKMKKNDGKNNENILNSNKIIGKNINIIKEDNNKKNIETINYPIITANDISIYKNRKQLGLTETNSNDNKCVLNLENKNEKENKQNKKKEKEENNKNYLNKKKSKDSIILDDMEHKTVDEIYEYINNDKIVKSKKKKKSRKNKKAKKEEIIIGENQEGPEDSIVVQFKEDVNEKCIHAGSITKIKPIISEKWIQKISDYD